MLFEIFAVLPQAHLLKDNRDSRRIPLSLKRLSRVRNINIIYNQCVHTIRICLVYFAVWISWKNKEFNQRNEH